MKQFLYEVLLEAEVCRFYPEEGRTAFNTYEAGPFNVVAASVEVAIGMADKHVLSADRPC